jgi:hypothetical protein
MPYGKSWAIKLPIVFPSLLCGIILAQHPNILIPADEPCKRKSPLSFHFKLFEGKHAADIAGPSRKVSSPRKVSTSTMNRNAMITSMEAAVRALDEQKKELEKVISALRQEEADEKGLAAENADVGDEGVGDAADVSNAAGDAIGDDDAGGDTEELDVGDSSASF